MRECSFDSGLAALDALHVAAAVSVGVEELVTTEKPDKPICRIQSIKAISEKDITLYAQTGYNSDFLVFVNV